MEGASSSDVLREGPAATSLDLALYIPHISAYGADDPIPAFIKYNAESHEHPYEPRALRHECLRTIGQSIVAACLYLAVNCRRPAARMRGRVIARAVRTPDGSSWRSVTRGENLVVAGACSRRIGHE